jgi:hypothetical protein
MPPSRSGHGPGTNPGDGAAGRATGARGQRLASCQHPQNHPKLARVTHRHPSPPPVPHDADGNLVTWPGEGNFNTAQRRWNRRTSAQ